MLNYIWLMLNVDFGVLRETAKVRHLGGGYTIIIIQVKIYIDKREE